MDTIAYYYFPHHCLLTTLYIAEQAKTLLPSALLWVPIQEVSYYSLTKIGYLILAWEGEW